MYYLTPTGFAEKARLTGEFLSTSLALFRQSGSVFDDILLQCELAGHHKLLFVGLSDLTEIAFTRSLQCKVEVLGVYQPNANKSQFFGLPVYSELADCVAFDRIVMTSMEQTSDLLSELEHYVDQQTIIVPSLLLLSLIHI